MATLKAKDLSIVRFALGDPQNAIEIAASGSVTSAPIDLSRIDLASATIVLARTAGTGTLKVSGAISYDGVNDLVPLGDLITAVTTTPKAFALTDSAFEYGAKLTLTITETGASAAATGRCYLTAKGA